MPQILYSKQYGQLSFDKTFILGSLHIGKLSGGAGYCHVSGAPIASKEEGLKALPPGMDREEFAFWWDNKGAMMDKAPRRMIIVSPDGAYVFDDGEAITSAQQLIEYFGSGEAVEAPLKWFAKELNKQEALQKESAKLTTTRAGQMGAEKAKRGRKVFGEAPVEDSVEMAIKD